MSESPQPRPGARRRRKPLNITGIKSIIVFISGCATAVGGALTGLGSQVAFAPMLTWMLGFGAEKAQATALRYAAVAAAAGVFGAYAAHQMSMDPNAAGIVRSETTPTQFWPLGLLIGGLLIFVGATIGAVLTARFAPKPYQVGKRRIFQTIGVGVGLFVITQVRLIAVTSTYGEAHYALWHSFPHYAWPALLLLGALVGGMTQVLGLSSGVLMVPALYFLGGYTAAQAATLSLLVVVLASLLPAWSYSRRGLVDATYSLPAALGGLFGGLLGGLTLAHLSAKFILGLFAVIVMFLSARELSRMALEPPPPGPEPQGTA